MQVNSGFELVLIRVFKYAAHAAATGSEEIAIEERKGVHVLIYTPASYIDML